jgi:hypothetical protein
MNECVARYPQLKLFSLPTMLPDGGRRLELGVRGEIAAADAALPISSPGSSGGVSMGTAGGGVRTGSVDAAAANRSF